MNRYLITHETFEGQEFLISALCDERGRMLEVQASHPQANSILGNIYIGKVENVVKNLNAAFIRISPTQVCYYPLDECKNPIFTEKLSTRAALAAGDELFVQVKKEALKTKEPTVTTNLNFPGKYIVLTTENNRFGVSAKLAAADRERLAELLSDYKDREYGVIVRTNAKDAPTEEILAEAEALTREYEELMQTAKHLSCYSCIRQEKPSYLRRLNDLKQDELAQIITDDETVFKSVCAMYGIGEEQLISGGSVPTPLYEVTAGHIQIRCHMDTQISLPALYSVRSQIENALKERVWLKSGAYLIIQPTEALTVIDVNTGKNVAKKDAQENFLRINIEAAEEIAHQLRLRNLSGIVVVDFISLKSKAAQDTLMCEFQRALKSDPVRTDLIDITPLGLVEVTRKKVQKTLAESLTGKI